MKKFYTIAALLFSGVMVFAQENSRSVVIEANNYTDEAIFQTLRSSRDAQRVLSRDGEVAWSEDFADLEGWTTGGEDGDIWWRSTPIASTLVPAGWGGSATSHYDYSLNPNLEDKYPRFYGTTTDRRIISETLSNGFLMADSDTWNNNGNNTFGQITPDGHITSPVIDLSDNEGAVVGIAFTTSMRTCCAGAGEMLLEVSTDGFDTFTSYNVRGAQDNNAIARDRLIELNVVSAFNDNSDWSNFQFRFNMNGGMTHYFWMIDDIEVFTIETAELSVVRAHYNDHWYAVAYDWENEELSSFVVNDQTVQMNQIRPQVVVENIGGILMTNVILTATITGPNDYSVELVSAPKSIDLGVTDTLFTAVHDMPLDAELGLYTINFSVSAEQEEEDLSNNVATANFRMSDWEYAKDKYTRTGTWTNTTGNGNDAGDYRIGPGFYMFDDATLYGAGFRLGPGSTVGAIFDIDVYDFDYNGSNPEGYLDGKVGVEVTSDMIGNMTYIAFDDPIELDADEGYVVYLSYNEEGSGDKVYIDFAGLGAPLSNFLRFINANLNFYVTQRPMIRMVLDDDAPVDFVSVNENTSLLADSKVFPNPSNADFELRYTLAKDANVQFELTDITGKLVDRKVIGRQASGVEHTYTINGSNLRSGIYLYSIIVDGERTTKKIIKN